MEQHHGDRYEEQRKGENIPFRRDYPFSEKSSVTLQAHHDNVRYRTKRVENWKSQDSWRLQGNYRFIDRHVSSNK